MVGAGRAEGAPERRQEAARHGLARRGEPLAAAHRTVALLAVPLPPGAALQRTAAAVDWGSRQAATPRGGPGWRPLSGQHGLGIPRAKICIY